MKRTLALLLALIMVIGMIPMALADEVVPVENTESTIAEGGETEGENTPACTEHTVKTWTVTPATCIAAGKEVGVCDVCGTQIEKVLDATGEHDYDENGVCKTEGCGAKKPEAVYAASAADLKLSVGATASMDIVFTVDGAPAKDVATTGVSYASSDDKVAKVNEFGAVTGVKKGTATITATVSGVNGVDKVTCKVTVSDVAQIVCEDRSTSGEKITLVPVLKINGETVKDATFDFKVSGKADTSDTTDTDTLTLTKDVVEVVEINISVREFEDADGNEGDASSVDDITVYVSFYDDIDAEATVKAGVTSFMFDDTNVFSSVKIDGQSASKPANYTMKNLWYSAEDWDVISLSQDDSESKVAIVSYPGSTFNAFDPYKDNEYSSLAAAKLKFTCVTKGTFELTYALYNKDGLTVQTGDITITVTEGGGADLEYRTSFEKELVLEENDFAKLWNKEKMDSDLDYVTFEFGTLVGELMTDGTKKADKVTDKMEFSYDYDEDDDDYDLDDVTYIPYAKANKAYEETIYFTCVGEDDDEVFHGMMVISVGEEVSFSDVKKTDYFYDAVEWAVNAGVTSGTSATTFSPAATCTREQVVTFLWRAAGEPKPSATTKMKFTDVDKDAYYYDAVMWAVEEGITTGTSATTFSPKATVTRGQVVTFLHRAMGEEEVSASNPFTDVKKADYFYEAVLWAVKNEVTTGLSATSFGPNSGCTRGQIVTFLYRAYEG